MSPRRQVKAIFIERYGPPEVLREREVPSRQPGADEIKLRVMASGINFADILQRLNLYGSSPPSPPYVPGFEVAGEVIAAGDATDLKPGDRVAAMTRFGGYAEEVCVPGAAARPFPRSLDFTQAAAIPVNFLTAWFCLYELGGLRAGSRVLIQGGAGGVGTAAVQLARQTGAEVFATAGSDEKIEFLSGLGADHPINYRQTDFSQAVRDATGGAGLDLVLDAAGGDALRRGYELLAPLGRLVCYGLSEAAPSRRRSRIGALRALWRTPSFKPLDLIGRNVGVYGFHLGRLEGREAAIAGAWDAILDLVESGAVRPVIARTFPLSAAGAAAAHHFIHDRANLGKVVLVRQQDT